MAYHSQIAIPHPPAKVSVFSLQELKAKQLSPLADLDRYSDCALLHNRNTRSLLSSEAIPINRTARLFDFSRKKKEKQPDNELCQF